MNTNVDVRIHMTADGTLYIPVTESMIPSYCRPRCNLDIHQRGDITLYRLDDVIAWHKQAASRSIGTNLEQDFKATVDAFEELRKYVNEVENYWFKPSSRII